MSIQVLNNSQLVAFRQCPYRWGQHYVHKLVPKIESIDARFWGTLYHLGTETLWNTKDVRSARLSVDDAAAAKDSELEQIMYDGEADTEEHRDLLETARKEVHGSIDSYRDHMAQELREWVVLGTEITARAIVSRGVHHEGTIDLVAWDPRHSRVVVVDHKSTAMPVDSYEGRLQLDTQHVGYTYMVKDMLRRRNEVFSEAPDAAFKPDTPMVFQWHVVRRKVPSVPSINKMTKKEAELDFQKDLLTHQTETGEHQGLVSTRQIDTLPSIYEQALDEQVTMRGLAITDKQADLLDSLKRKGDSFFGMTETFVPDDRIDRWKAEFLIDAKRIRLAVKDHSMMTRNASACSMPGSPRCDYREICINPDAVSGYRMDMDIIDPMQERK